MDTIILTVHVVVCVFLVILVLLQSGKEGMGVIFGGGSSSLFGSSGAGGVLAKMTMFVAIAFVVTSLGYNIATTERKPVQSVVPSVKLEDAAPAAQPAPPAVQPQEGQTTEPPKAQ
ncbi:preprotein translocase subunit SecG [Desulfovibrio sp. OttesenSCG-928-O18]|nr:preprotein translocase subunit SecG [Desulfovibrio sp. OttesenSCG-928-O18]